MSKLAEKINERLIVEYISKVRCCDECFASVYCTVNGLRESRVPQEYCVKNIKRYFGDKAKPVEERKREKWEHLKEHITDMRNADGAANQTETCQFILNLMGVIEREKESDHMAILTSGEWAVYHTRKKLFVCGMECGTDKLILTDEPIEVQYFETKERAEMAMAGAKCGKCYKAVRVKLAIKEDNEK